MSNITINIAEDGGTVQVGDKTYQVTLITPAEPKPVEGKWYRRVKDGCERFTINKFYQSDADIDDFNDLCFFINNEGVKNGEFKSQVHLLFDLTTPLDFDPETLVGKTLEWPSVSKVVVTKIEWPNLMGTFKDQNDYIHPLLGILEEINDGDIKVLDPEPTLTVPENVEFVDWIGDQSLVYNGFVLCGVDNGFTFADVRTNFKRITNLKLIPCKLDEVQNGEWVVLKDYINQPNCYILVTSIGAVYFENKHTPIKIEPFNDKCWRKKDWLKVVQG